MQSLIDEIEAEEAEIKEQVWLVEKVLKNLKSQLSTGVLPMDIFLIIIGVIVITFYFY